jgi:hypothetical protein
MIDLIQHIEQGGTLMYEDTKQEVKILSTSFYTITIAGLQSGFLEFNRWGFHKKGTSLKLIVK